MRISSLRLVVLSLLVLNLAVGSSLADFPATHVSIVGDTFHINGQPTYAGRTWNGKKIEGLLFNSRMVQATFDDRNPDTAARWAYPDTKKWDADRNASEFIEMMPTWRKHGLLADFLLLHGNGVAEPHQIVEMVRRTRLVEGYRPMPIVFNEDDHFNFDQTENNFVAAVGEYASWGYFDYRKSGESFDEGYQSVPVNWTTSSERKKAFFELLSEITGEKP